MFLNILLSQNVHRSSSLFIYFELARLRKLIGLGAWEKLTLIPFHAAVVLSFALSRVKRPNFWHETPYFPNDVIS
jgi:hypothetical protein